MSIFIRHAVYGVGKILDAEGCDVRVSFFSQSGPVERKFRREAFGDTILRHTLRKDTPCIIDGENAVVQSLFVQGEGGIPHIYEVRNNDGTVSHHSEDKLEIRMLEEIKEQSLGNTKFASGSFVKTFDEHGLGKLLQLTDSTAVVEFFTSPGKVQTREYSCGWERTYLYPNTRVYWLDDFDLWRIGLVKRWMIEHNLLLYEVLFPNKVCRILKESDIFVRCLSAESNPVEIITNGGMETQFYHDARTMFLSRVIEQRKVTRGLSGAFSSSVELVPHQLMVARRILSDPIQRYILADEVGLGKTIEAGFVIRQTLIDKPCAIIVVLAPQNLVEQWKSELHLKFNVEQFRIQPEVLPYHKYGELHGMEIELLVIDEAHHAFSPGVQTNDLTILAVKAKRLLLLTATPVIGNEDSFLQMLQVLDPDVHGKESSNAFRQKVFSRQQFGALARSLDKDASPLILSMVMETAEELLGQDRQAMDLISDFKNAVDRNDAQARGLAVERLQWYVVETYRVYHRLIRNRRKDLPEWVMLPRSNGSMMDHVQVIASSDPAVSVLVGHWESWRMSALSTVGAQPENHEELVRALAQDCARLFEALGSGGDVFAFTLESLIQEKRPGGLLPDVHSILLECQNVTHNAIDAVEVDARAALETLRSNLSAKRIGVQRPLDCVIFISNERIAAALRTRLRTLNRIKVKVESARGEEGKNFQDADGIIHLDLPLNPARVEQRIGRLDRFGRSKDFLTHVIKLPSISVDSPWMAWYEVLANGFNVFSGSIADVQFLLEKEKSNLEKSLFLDGVYGLVKYGRTLPDRLQQERDELDDQYALDAQLEMDSNEGGWFESLEEADSDENQMANDMNAWLCEALFIEKNRLPDAFFRYSWNPARTAIPREPWASKFTNGLERKATYFRAEAAKACDVDLVRIGHPLIDGIERFSRWDTRGIAFATWHVCRQMPPEAEPWLGLKLFYVIEGDLHTLENDVYQRSNLAVARRCVDGLLPPWTQTLYLDLNLDPVQDEYLLNRLSLPMDSPEGRGVNLGSRLDCLARVIDFETLNSICRKAAQRGQELIRSGDMYHQVWNRAWTSIQASGELNRRRLALRLEKLKSANATAAIKNLEDELRLDESIRQAVIDPNLRLESMGVIVLAPGLPE